MGVNSIKIGGTTFGNADEIFKLVTKNYGNTSGPDHFSGFYAMGESSPYEIPAGKSLVILAIRYIGGSNQVTEIGYADNGIGIGVPVGDLVNPVYPSGALIAGQGQLVIDTVDPFVNGTLEGTMTGGYVFPAGKFVFAVTNSTDESHNPTALYCKLI